MYINIYDRMSGATNFNGDLSQWNTSSVLSMLYTFDQAASFESDISGWNTTLVQSFLGLFQGKDGIL